MDNDELRRLTDELDRTYRALVAKTAWLEAGGGESRHDAMREWEKTYDAHTEAMKAHLAFMRAELRH